MSLNVFDGGRLVESRHCRELAKILEKDFERWNDVRQALGISANEIELLSLQVKEENISPENALYEIINIWMNKCPKNANFGTLIDVLGRQLEFFEAANKIMESDWN